jgi:2,3-bisphosphoglycerate-independent phosphoglycerate mutase
MDAMFPSEKIDDSLGQIISQKKLKQLRIAETEKYAHVTFFFNCGVEQPYEGEDRILVKSPSVATYDLQPTMAAEEINVKLIAELEKQKYDLSVVNFANADMVGHTGNMDATVEAVKTLDGELKKLTDTILKLDGTLIIIADHGNAEKMFDEAKNQPHTAHTTNKVPFIVVSNDSNKKVVINNNSSLIDIAPTILKMLGLKKPRVMSGKNLVE